MKKYNYKVGRLGENMAVNYLLRHKYNILDRNFYCNQGEIDIIAEKEKYIIFIEVKTRTTQKYGKPVEAVNNIKQKHIYQSAKYYLYKNNKLNRFIRFDVIEIVIKNYKTYINHIKQIM